MFIKITLLSILIFMYYVKCNQQDDCKYGEWCACDDDCCPGFICQQHIIPLDGQSGSIQSQPAMCVPKTCQAIGDMCGGYAGLECCNGLTCNAPAKCCDMSGKCESKCLVDGQSSCLNNDLKCCSGLKCFGNLQQSKCLNFN
ncbi:uncharacterized protein LOC128957945 [Oppia nitens]|uniref:uncharacterized protein LOC128957945 n=1 Tax=Oppia nitens TaxID=1686743 RepID=UPI0023DA625E|nr:uncharacterized protein LOC128957945 [Oppia nitens]